MKNINSYKLAIVATSLVMAYFASGIATLAQAAELVKAERIKQATLINQAQANLAVSFDAITMTTSKIQSNAKNMLAKKKASAIKNKEITISKTTLISE